MKAGVETKLTAAAVAGVVDAVVDRIPATMPNGKLFICALVRTDDVKVVLGGMVTQRTARRQGHLVMTHLDGMRIPNDLNRLGMFAKAQVVLRDGCDSIANFG